MLFMLFGNSIFTKENMEFNCDFDCKIYKKFHRNLNK